MSQSKPKPVITSATCNNCGEAWADHVAAARERMRKSRTAAYNLSSLPDEYFLEYVESEDCLSVLKTIVSALREQIEGFIARPEPPDAPDTAYVNSGQVQGRGEVTEMPEYADYALSCLLSQWRDLLASLHSGADEAVTENYSHEARYLVAGDGGALLAIKMLQEIWRAMTRVGAEDDYAGVYSDIRNIFEKFSDDSKRAAAKIRVEAAEI